MVWKIVSIVLVVLLLLSGIGGYCYSQREYQKGLEKGQANLKEAENIAKKAGYQEAVNDVEKAVKKLGFSSIEEAEAKLKQLVKAPKPLEDPTYDRLMKFVNKALAKDRALKNKLYSEKKPGFLAEWVNYTYERPILLKEKAQKEGIRAALMCVIIQGYGGYLMNAFRVTDRPDLIYVDLHVPGGIAKVEIGKDYFVLNNLPRPPRSGNIVYITKPSW